ncbi:hypothetical protein K490DRAFT_32368 [Saccharata proteae CBS 121410]|uniref:DNA-binding protein RAP1 n=1 Tax=Saccharata proteae CBS 121410 TaxID=1314787 RepID=A0A9P4LZW7_9PEZI|nr:hypothetical protein K490DRAFT_32368 [Saccharata proteae CBS 121410]
MAPHVVYTDPRQSSPAAPGDLFAGKKFWIAQRCPTRSDFVNLVRWNGGQVVPLEKQADYLIHDHARKDSPPGALSYRFIEQSVRDAEIKNPEDHLCGPPSGTVRPAGLARTVAGGRVPYSAADDVELYQWVKQCESQGLQIKGNKIYEQLAERNPRHPAQSWRDRYLKILVYKPPMGADTVAANPPPSSPLSETPAPLPVVVGPPFTVRDLGLLMETAFDIQNIRRCHWKHAWKTWADAYPPFTANEWEEFWETTIKDTNVQLHNRAGQTILASAEPQDLSPSPLKDPSDAEFTSPIAASQSARSTRKRAREEGDIVEADAALRSVKRQRNDTPDSLVETAQESVEVSPKASPSTPSKSHGREDMSTRHSPSPQPPRHSEKQNPKRDPEPVPKTGRRSRFSGYLQKADHKAYITSRTAPPYRYTEDQVVRALHATCMHGALSDEVLGFMRSHRGAVGPANKKGIWTGQDDRELRSGSREARERVERKHGGEKICAYRRRYLELFG